MSRTHYFAVASLVLIASSSVFMQPAPASAADVCYQMPARDLYVGVAPGEDVRNLQQVLNREPVPVASGTNAGSVGSETVYFRYATRSAVMRFQSNYNIASRGNAGYGRVGPLTRAKLQSLYGCGEASSDTARSNARVVVSSGQDTLDYGDVPAPYPTTLASNGARHQTGTAVYLGSCVDAEPDGVPSADAIGDNSAVGGNTRGTCAQPGNDEEGVTFHGDLLVGDSDIISVNANAACLLSGWVDWNANGSWDDAGEKVISNVLVGGGFSNQMIEVPTSAVPGSTYARFRCSTQPNLSPTGEANDGEVEDYKVIVAAQVTSTLTVDETLPITNNTSATLRWTSNGASCAASGGWSGTKAANGTESVGPLTSDTTFFLRCTNGADSIARNIKVTVQPAQPDTTTYTLTVNNSGNGTINGLLDGSGNVISCGTDCSETIPAGDGTKEIALSATPATGYRFSSWGGSGCKPGTPNAECDVVMNADKTITATFEQIQSVSATLSTSSSLPIAYGGNAVLNWTASNASSCTASGGWSGAKSTNGGTQTIGPLTATTNFALSCAGTGGPVDRNVTVTVQPQSSPQPIPASGNLRANVRMIPLDGSRMSDGVIESLIDINPYHVYRYTSSEMSVMLPYYALTNNLVVNAITIPRRFQGSTLLGGYRIDRWEGCTPVSGTPTRCTLPISGATMIDGVPTIQVIAYLAPTTTSNVTATLSTSSSLPIAYGGNAVLNWTASNASSCTASGGWSGAKSTNGGTQTIGPLTATTNFALSCAGTGGPVDRNVTVTVQPQSSSQPIPTAGNVKVLWYVRGANGMTLPPGIGSIVKGYLYPHTYSGFQSTGGTNSTLYYDQNANLLVLDIIPQSGLRVDSWTGCTPTSTTSTHCEVPVSSATVVNGMPTLYVYSYLTTVTTSGVPSTSGIAGALGAFDQQASAPTASNASGLQHEWTRDLQIGSPHLADVIALQGALRIEGVYDGDITGGFYNQTYTAVKRFQEKYGISPMSGYVGALTRAKLNELY